MKRLFLSVFVCAFYMSSLAQTIQDAKKLTENEQYEAASAAYQSLIATSPNDVVNYYFYGDNLLVSDNPDSATIIFDKAGSIDPNNPFIKIGRAKVLLDAINIKEAKSASEKDPNPENARRYQEAQSNQSKASALIDEAITNAKDVNVLVEAAEALIHYKTRDLDKAKPLLDNALKMDARNYEALLLYGDVYRELNNGTLAADYYNKALDVNPKSPRAIVSKGILYKRSTNYEGAAREFENAIKLDPNYAPAHRELGEAYIKLGKLAPAKEEYKKYLELSKNNCGARIRYAYFLYISKAYQDAINELNQIGQRCDSNNNSLLRVKMYSYYEIPDYQKSLDAANKLFSQVPPDKRTAVDLEYYGKALIKASPDSAGVLMGIDQLQKALAMDPSQADIYSAIGEGYAKLKQYMNAIQIMVAKLSLGKEFKVIDYYNLANDYYLDKQFLSADSAAMKVNELSPTYPAGWLLRARINAGIDTTAEEGRAKPFYEKYIELTTVDSISISKYKTFLDEAYRYLSFYYGVHLDNANAILYQKKRLDLLPADSNERKQIQKLIEQIQISGQKAPPKK
jgi:tetratricopeptide (TPR) repeat protein